MPAYNPSLSYTKADLLAFSEYEVNSMLSNQTAVATALYGLIQRTWVEMDVMFLLFAAVFVFLMQAGFSLLEAGTLRAKNVRNILTKNMLEPITGGILFWLVGYGIAYGGSNDNGFAGDILSGGKFSFAFRVDDDGANADNTADNGYAWISFFFQFAFAAASTTIVSGAVGGRVSITGYLVYSTVMMCFIYPVIVHWCWDSEGWLCAWGTHADDNWGGVMDFAGSGVVHMTGGTCALTAAAILGPRKHRFEPDFPSAGHSAPLQVLGTFLLWVGWYGFNCGSTLGIHTYAGAAGRVAVTTTLSAITGGLMTTILAKITTGKYDLGFICNGILGGLVGITAGCVAVEPYASVAIGLISGVVVFGAHHAVLAAGIDDPLDAFAVHGACGAWGVISLGAFATEDYTYNKLERKGFFYGGDGKLLGVQLLFVLCIIAWAVPMMAFTAGGCRLLGIFRVEEDVELSGIDIVEHEGQAYTIVVAIPSSEKKATP